MKLFSYKTLYLLSLIILPTLFSPTYSACKITDDSGQIINLNKPTHRIISLAPDITETLFAIGAGKQIVGVIQGSDFPAAANKIPQVGSYTGIDLEKIISLHPDLIVTWSNTFSRQLTVLKKFGIPIYKNEPRQLEDIPRTMKNLGCITGNENIATVEAEKFSQGIEILGNQFQNQKPITVFYQIGSYSLITVNKDSWINQVISLCGGKNVFATAKSIAPEMSWESLVAANPEVVISDATNPDWKRWSSWPEIAAVKHHFLFTINPDLIERAGPRLLNGATQICKDLHAARIVK